MLNENNERELAYVVAIDGIEPIVGSDNCEAAIVNGWRVMVRKNTFKVGDLAIYFEIDSHVDTTIPEFAFLASKHGNIKTQKYTFGGKGLMISQGLLMSPADFGWKVVEPADEEGTYPYFTIIEGGVSYTYVKGDFMTKILGVTYAVAEDNSRKASSGDKYKKMAQRHAKLFSRPVFRWLMQRDWGRKLLFALFGRKRDKKNAWPAWVAKTDEERIQNMPWILNNKEPWVATEKIDGTSTTFTMKRGNGLFKKDEFYICSRNVVFDKPDKKCFYDTNVYVEMAEKYNIEEVLKAFLDARPDVEWVTLQGETYGDGIQKRTYGLTNGEHKFMGFNLITSTEGRWNSVDAKLYMEKAGVPWVPILTDVFYLPDTVDELLAIATANSELDNELREGLVLRSQDGQKSFKAVSNEFLLKYHG